jgi:hypothetical protein
MTDDDDGSAIGYKVLPKGTPVVTADGVEIGTVVKAQDDDRTHIFDGIVIKTPEGRRFVDAPEVARITEKRVTLTIDAAEAASLPEHRGLRGSLETRAQRRLNRLKRRLPGG